MAHDKNLPAIVPDEKDIQAFTTSLAKEGWGKGVRPELQRAVARMSLAYGLDPMADELLVMGGQKLYVTVAGLRRHALRSDRLNGVQLVPYTMVGSDEDEVWWQCEVRLKGCEFPFVEFGKAGGKKETNSVAKGHPHEMARTRALGRALRLATGISLPVAEEAEEFGMPYSREPKIVNGIAAVTSAHVEKPAELPSAPAVPTPGRDALISELNALAGVHQMSPAQMTQALARIQRDKGATITATMAGGAVDLTKITDDILHAAVLSLRPENPDGEAAE